MKKALERLDSLISKRIDPAQIEKANYSDEQLLYCLIIATEECENIRLHLSTNARKIKGKENLEHFFRHYQNSLVYLLDRLFSYKKTQADPALNRIYDKVSEGVAKLLEYFSTMFVDYFNIDGKVPDRALQLSKESLQVDWKKLQQLMVGHGVSEELLKAATEPILLFMTGTHSEAVTHRWHAYIKALMTQLSEWAQGKHDDAEWELISLILYMNVNSRKCRAYCINYIVGFTDGLYDPKDKLDRLEWLLKRSRLIQVKPATAFDAKQTTLKEHIEEWILTEMGFAINKLTQASDKIAVKNDDTDELELKQKILSGLTVEEQGTWTKGEMKAGKILNETASEVMDIIKLTHETKRSRNPSAGSMARKTKELTARSIEKMRRMLKIMDAYFEDLLDA